MLGHDSSCFLDLTNALTERLEMQAVDRFNSQFVGRTLAWGRKGAIFIRTNRFVSKPEVTDLDKWLVDLDESLLYSFHIKITTIGYSRCPNVGVISIQHITVFSQNGTSIS